jgi:hypothetical protein
MDVKIDCFSDGGNDWKLLTINTYRFYYPPLNKVLNLLILVLTYHYIT